MAPPPIMSGARAKVGIVLPGLGTVRTIGIFNSFSYDRALHAEASYILGRMSAASQQYTSYEPVSCRASGWRVVDHDAHVECGFPTLQDALFSDYLQITVVDRVTKKAICVIKSVLCLAESGSFAAKQLSEITVPFQGLMMSSESRDNFEPADASVLPV